MALYCERCEAPISQPKGSGRPRRFCSDACRKQVARSRDLQHYLANRGRLMRRDLHLMAYDRAMVPFVPKGQIKAFDANRPAWHAHVYGGKRHAK